MIHRTTYISGRSWPRSKILAHGLGAMLVTARECLEYAREARREEYAKYVVRQPVLDIPGWVPMHQARPVLIRTRGNPWRDARRARERERLALFESKEG